MPTTDNMKTKTNTDNMTTKTKMPTNTNTDNETDIEPMTQEIEILSDNQDSPNSTSSTDRNADSQRSMSEESTSEDDPNQRRSTRLSHKDLPNSMYVPMKRVDYGVQERKKPLPSYRRNGNIGLTKRMLAMERIQLEKERALLERERRLLEKERQQNEARQSAEQTRLDSWLKTEPNQQFQLISVPETTSTSTTIANIFQPGSGTSYTVASSEGGGAVPTVRDYLKNQLNIQRGKTTHLPPLRVFKQRKPSVLPTPQPTTMLYTEQNPNPQTILQRLITANQHQAVPNTLRFMKVPQMAGGATLASFNQIDSQADSLRKLLNSTVEDIERPHKTRQRIRTCPDFHFGRRHSTEDEDDSRQSTNEIATQSANTEEDDIEVVFEKNKPVETRQDSNSNDNSTESTNYAFNSDINNLHPLNFKYLLKQAEAQTAATQEKKKKRAATTTIKPEISNVMPLDLASLLGDGNSNQESIYSEIIELDDDSPVKSKKSKNEVTTEITEVRPLDLNSLFTKSNGSEGSPSTSTNSEDTQLLNSETTMLEESDVIDEAHKLFQVSSSKPMKVRGAPRARAKKWKTMNPEEEREAIMKILRQL